MAGLAQTITIIKDRKVVSTSKQLVNIFKEGKIAYQQKKSELKAARQGDSINHASTYGPGNGRIKSGHTSPMTDSRARVLSGNAPNTYQQHPSQSGMSTASFMSRADFRPMERSYTDSVYTNNGTHPAQSAWSMGGYPANDGYPAYDPRDYEQHELSRRYSGTDLRNAGQQPYYERAAAGLARSTSFDGDLAHGELAPPLPPRPLNVEAELQTKMFSVNRILEETNCMQHSAKAIIKHLQTNPEAMAAVALTLAEISKLLTKARPGALLAFRGVFPAVIALLLSPEFLIAAGVGVGLTVVAFGGYKIVKRVKARKASSPLSPETDELEDITYDVEQINTWHRGVSEYDVQSIGTSVDAELITPMASVQLRERAMLEGAAPMPPRYYQQHAREMRPA